MEILASIVAGVVSIGIRVVGAGAKEEPYLPSCSMVDQRPLETCGVSYGLSVSCFRERGEGGEINGSGRTVASVEVSKTSRGTADGKVAGIRYV